MSSDRGVYCIPCETDLFLRGSRGGGAGVGGSLLGRQVCLEATCTWTGRLRNVRFEEIEMGYVKNCVLGALIIPEFFVFFFEEWSSFMLFVFFTC